MVTIRDVANHAQVSVTSVSHVLNETRPVSDALRARVQAAMNELGYQPNLLARSLRRGQTHTLGMIVPDNVNPFFAEVARGIEDVSFARGYSLILCNSDANLQKELLYTGVLADKQVDGIVFVAAGLSAEHVAALQRREIPVVVVDREMADAAADTVMADNAQGGWLATQHLLELGHTHIACIAGPSVLTPSSDRSQGYRRALEGTGLTVDETLIVRGEFDFASGHRAAQELLQRADPPTAIFACNDLMAVGAISAATELGFNVPDQLSIVGFDDVSLASYTNPPLTTVAQPMYNMGSLAAMMLLERLQGSEAPPVRQVLNTRLVVRRSSAQPRSS